MDNDIPLDEIVTLAQNLIKIHSTQDSIAGINQAILLVEKKLNNFTVKTFNANGKQSLLIHNDTQNKKHFKIILNAHVDIIPGKKEQFEPHIVDGRLYGRGAYDMKAALSVMLILFKNIAKKVPYPLALQITTDEEKGMLSAKKQIEEGIRGDFILTGECGNNFQVTNRAKGVYHAKLTASGISAHGGYPWLGDNAILKLHKTIDLILHMYPYAKKETHKTTINITRITSTNTVTNKTPDHAQAHLDIRYAPEDKNIFSTISHVLPKGITIEAEAHYSALNTPADNKYIRLLQKIGKDVLKHNIKTREAHATSDVVQFAQVGCNGIEFGPVGANQHADNEWVDIQSLSDYYQILKNFLLSIT